MTGGEAGHGAAAGAAERGEGREGRDERRNLGRRGKRSEINGRWYGRKSSEIFVKIKNMRTGSTWMATM
jgi:hypothetical protein